MKKPVGYARREHVDNGLCTWAVTPISQSKILDDDVPLYTVAPLSVAETEAIAEAIDNLEQELGYTSAHRVAAALRQLLERQK